MNGTVLVKDKKLPNNGTRRIPADAFNDKLHVKVEEPVEKSPEPKRKSLFGKE